MAKTRAVVVRFETKIREQGRRYLLCLGGAVPARLYWFEFKWRFDVSIVTTG
jgi:hypothetical protein